MKNKEYYIIKDKSDNTYLKKKGYNNHYFARYYNNIQVYTSKYMVNEILKSESKDCVIVKIAITELEEL